MILLWYLDGNNLLFSYYYLHVSALLTHYYHIVTEVQLDKNIPE